MFGLEKKKSKEGLYDLEKEMLNHKSRQKLEKETQTKLQQIKSILRTGDTGEEYDLFGILLHSYAALEKVLDRLGKKSH